MSSHGHSTQPPTSQQIQATNDTITELSGLGRTAMESQIKQLPNILKECELPEKVLAVRYKNHDTCLFVSTNLRIMFVTERMFSRSGEVRVEDFPWNAITGVEWSPGKLSHRITIRMGRKKVDCQGPGIHGQVRPRKMAEYLQAKVSGTQEGAAESVAKDAKTAKGNAIEDMVRSMPIPPIGSEWKQLSEVLEDDEMPERFLSAEYDDRHGVKVSSGQNRMGMLVATDRRLVFVYKPPLLRPLVNEFPYDTIDGVAYSKGLIRGEVKVSANGLEEIFKTFGGSDAAAFAEYLGEKLGKPCQSPESATEAPVTFDQVVKDARGFAGFIKSKVVGPSDETPAANNAGTPADELVKFADLLDRGLITQEEFEARKVRLLGS